MDDPSEAEEEAWCANERTRVIDYLDGEGLGHGDVGSWPAWHLWPYVAVWAIESVERPGSVGWWAISGDLPTDYTPCGPERHPREAMRDIAGQWQEAAACWALGKSPEGWSLGAPEDRPVLGPLLAVRAKMLLSFVADDSLWEE